MDCGKLHSDAYQAGDVHALFVRLHESSGDGRRKYPTLTINTGYVAVLLLQATAALVVVYVLREAQRVTGANHRCQYPHNQDLWAASQLLSARKDTTTPA